MQAKHLLIFSMFLSIVLAVVILTGQERELSASRDRKLLRKPVPIDEQATSKQVKLLLDRFSRRNKIDVLKSIKKRTIELDKKEFLIKTEREMFEKTLGKITEIVAKNNKKDVSRIDRLESMLAEFKQNISEFDEKLTKEENEKLQKVIRSFKEIKAKKSALIIPEMDRVLVVKVMLALPARNSAAILQNLNPKLAANISQRMAEERKKRRLKKRGNQLLNKNKGRK